MMILQQKLADWARKGMEDQGQQPGQVRVRRRGRVKSTSSLEASATSGMQLNLFE
ncbi:hypothetical protein PP178_07710 [Zeaxanthinibacter sp. PT1]|uniref:hypothetical protein n=1 Tax=Zeaxanthinibacter TaxID=561554 RepID=UPI0023491AE6|nr:hypothetical protein [Zeaxanthinibacter sp. PT1]MDC6351436.1 hypothetical protein [Zeaxanthinibacter sp. PT1]